MERFTKKSEDTIYIVEEMKIQHNQHGYFGEAIDKLASFENMYEDLIKKQAVITKEMEKLKLEGKEKTVKFKQLFANKLTNNNLLYMFEAFGIK